MDVPVIDLAHTGTRATARARAAEAVDQALTEHGFLTVVRHGIHPRTTARAFDAARTLFELPDPGDDGGHDTDSFAIAVGPGGRGAGWPDRVLDFREHWLGYLAAVDTVGRHVMELCALALCLPDSHFAPVLSQGRATLRADRHPAEVGADTNAALASTLTLLATDGLSGVEIASPPPGVSTTDRWAVATPPGSLVITVGDALRRWTNDRWRATTHHVVVAGEGRVLRGRRTSLAFTQRPDADAVIDCLPTCIRPDRPARYAPITVSDLERVSQQRQALAPRTSGSSAA